MQTLLGISMATRQTYYIRYRKLLITMLTQLHLLSLLHNTQFAVNNLNSLFIQLNFTYNAKSSIGVFIEIETLVTKLYVTFAILAVTLVMQ